MVDRAPEYTPQVNPGPGPTPGLQPIALTQAPTFDGAGRGGAAMAAFGTELGQVAEKIRVAQEHTKAAAATTGFLTELDGLEQKYTQDPDFQKAPQNFVRDQQELITKHSESIGDSTLRSRAVLEWTRAGISSSKRVRDTAFSREADTNVANLDAQENEAIKSAAAAGSPAERAAVVDRYVSANQQAADAGWIGEQKKTARVQAFTRKLDQYDALRDIRANPERARELLNDPAAYPSLDPIDRQHLVAQAANQADNLIITRAEARARAGNGEAVSLELGRLTDPAHAERLFRGGIVSIESNNDPAAVSPKGAIGLSQIMPDTARDVARQLGLKDVAALDNDALTKKLTDDPKLNYQLGLTYWREMLRRYDGHIPAAAAAYNAGPGKADEWVAAAQKKFGENFTAAQLATVVDYKETRDYIGKLYARYSASPTGLGLSPQGWYSASTRVSSALQHEDSLRGHAATAMARQAREADDVVSVVEAGLSVDPARLITYRTTQQQAADRGDVQAQLALHKLDEAVALKPYMDQAWRTPPAQLANNVAQITADLRTRPDVTVNDHRRAVAFKAVADEVEKQKNSDPVTLGEMAKLYVPVSLDVKAAPEDQNFRAALAERGRQAELAGAHYGGAMLPLKAPELSAFRERWTAAGEDERFRILGAAAGAMPPRAYKGLMTQLNLGPVETFAGQVARDRPQLAREILHGSALLGSKEIGDKVALIKPALAGKIGGELYADPVQQETVVSAALALYTARRGASGSLYDTTDTAGIEQAVEDVAGKIVKRNGVRVPVTPGISASQFTGALDRIDAGTVAMFGGAMDKAGRPIAAEDIASHAVLKAHAPGSQFYMVGMRDPSARDGFAPVMTENATPLVIDARVLVSLGGAGAAKPTRYDELRADIRRQRIERDQRLRELDAQ